MFAKILKSAATVMTLTTALTTTALAQFDDVPTTNGTPEPTTISLLIISVVGVVGLSLLRRRQKVG